MTVNLPVFKLYATSSAGWVRLFGRGFGWKDLSVHALVFSERNGHTRHLEIGRWSFAWLK